ncbi:hypothetical protein KR044_008655, partial [Drosophila immigrans]
KHYMSDIILQEAAPTEQRDAPSLQEALEVCPSDGPRPLTIAEYWARNTKVEKKKLKRSGRRVKLLQQRRLIKDLLNLATAPKEKEDYQKQLDALNKLLCTGAK